MFPVLNNCVSSQLFEDVDPGGRDAILMTLTEEELNCVHTHVVDILFYLRRLEVCACTLSAYPV